MAHTWELWCDRATFEKCRKDKKFAYVVALGRAMNAMHSAHSLFIKGMDGADAPKAFRDRMNGYFLVCSVLYEVIKLIRAMSTPFKNDATFQTNLRQLLKDPIAQKIEKDHFKSVRMGAMFHFLPDRFDRAIMNNKGHECVFARSDGNRPDDVDYYFADSIAGEIMLGIPEETPGFENKLRGMMNDTLDVVEKFTVAAETVIGLCLKDWGFQPRSTN